MATRMKMLKLLQEMRSLSDLSRLHPPQKPSALYLAELRQRIVDSHRPKRRLMIEIRMDASDFATIPTRIPIRHLPSSQERP